MTGEGGTVERPDPARAAASLRALLAAIDTGEVTASQAQRTYLAGAVDTLDQLAGGHPPSIALRDTDVYRKVVE